MDASARAYAASLAAILPPLGLELTEVDDWNCCGATEYLSLSPLGACALIARNLAIAAAHRHDGPGSDTLVAPCSACFVNLAKTDRSMRDDGALAASVNAALAAGGLAYTPGSVTVRHLLEVLLEDVGVDEIRRHVVRPLTGLRVAGYLGCLVSRPDQDHRWSQREHPLALDRLLAVLGAEVVDYPVRTDCCGGHMTQISPDTGFMLIRRLVDTAERTGAHLLATVCPMCQMNIDAYQGEMNHHYGTRYHVPILFFTQLVGLAFGASAKSLGIGSELVSAHDALSRIGIEVPPPDGVGAERRAPAKPVRRSRKDASLPMPPPLPDEEGYR
jgi:heterodisulfide reductase subunit B